MVYYDAHVHLDMFREGALENFATGDVRAIANSIDMESYGFAVKEKKANPNVVRVFLGQHPDRADLAKAKGIAAFIKENPVDGVGEIGLDPRYGDIDEQKKVFKLFLRVAKAKKLPVVVHSRDVVQDAMDLLKGFKGRVMMHWFPGGVEEMRECVARGYFIGFTPSHARQDKLIKETPVSNMLLETDSPVQGRQPHDVKDLYKVIGEKKWLGEKEFEQAIGRNVLRFLGIGE